MDVTINGCRLNVEVLGLEDGRSSSPTTAAASARSPNRGSTFGPLAEARDVPSRHPRVRRPGRPGPDGDGRPV
jgi:hypothetical protein